MTQRVAFLGVRSVLWSCKRGHGPNHWSVLKKKKNAKDKALEHFNDFYSTVYGSVWPHIRAAMLKKTHKYVAIVNNFSDTEDIVQKLQLEGAMDMKELYEVSKKSKADRDRKKQQLEPTKPIYKMDLPMENVLEMKTYSELKTLVPEGYQPSLKALDQEDDGLPPLEKPFEPVTLRPLEEDLAAAQLDESRIVRPSAGLTASSLHEYMPATKLKGLDDYILESEHYGYYSKSADFEIKVEEDSSFSFPEHLKIFTFEAGNDSHFPAPKRGSTGVYDYYLMDGGSVLPVLALDLHAGDVVLDMCAAPGGKSLIALQTLLPSVLVANDQKMSRVNLINNVLEEYLGDLDVWNGRLFVTQQDARVIEDKNIYNKILVDVPCTTDRHSLHNDDTNMFSPNRIKERLQLPEYQSSILLQALKILPIGGTVVYSTCSLSPIQNDGVVQMALKKNWEETQSVMVVKDITEGLGPLRTIYKFADDFGFKYGTVVLPTRKSNFGPTYFSKIVRVQ
ncbi:5-methylcytosine rRNA methyltransferase NSUN4 [Diachasma alloeum]|uniref:5-methylcytosine rRNA methyltransferase NSUN4 n=1 Tax=Diachasma alloeum TaxID=454923 RepID=UPI000738335B|nr:5-methylcytosine rRNA methyltransferase NSUN4 [Diachasma alloeum]